jgi:hypothetical protein
MNRTFATFALMLVLAGCAPATTGSTIKVTTKDSKDSVALKPRSVEFGVFAPSSLADGTGKIVNADPNGIVAQGAGNIVAQGAGNIVAQGAGNFKAAPTFRLMDAVKNYTPVENAVVMMYDLDDKPISKLAVTSKADGFLTLKNVPDGKPLVAVARWKQGDKIYRTSTVLGPGAMSEPLMIDAINHFVHARVKDILAKSGKLASVNPKDLKAVWEAFNKADIPLDGKLLADDATSNDLINFYKEQVAKLPCDDQKLVKDYMVKLGSDPSPVTCN